jgi:hypothetical protein
MKSYSVRLDPHDLTRLRAYAEARRLKPSTALRQLVQQGLHAAEAPPAKPPASSAEHGLLQQCLTLLRLLSLYQLHQFHRSFLQDQPIGSSLQRFHEAQRLANQVLDQDPALFGRSRFRMTEAPSKTKA